jgi:hypothetical protein
MSLPWKNPRQQLTETVGIENFEIEIPRYNSLLVDEQIEFDRLDKAEAKHQLSLLKFVQAIATDLEANYQGGDPKSLEDFANEAFAIVDSIAAADGKNNSAIVQYSEQLAEIMAAKPDPTRQVINMAELVIKSRVDENFKWNAQAEPEIPFKFYQAVYQFALKEKHGWPPSSNELRKIVAEEYEKEMQRIRAEQPTEGKSEPT